MSMSNVWCLFSSGQVKFGVTRLDGQVGVNSQVIHLTKYIGHQFSVAQSPYDKYAM